MSALLGAIKDLLDILKIVLGALWKAVTYFLPSEIAKRKLKTIRIEQTDESFFRYLKLPDIKVVELFLKAGKYQYAKDTDNNTALIIAAWHGFNEIAEALTKRKADVNAKGAYGNTALMAATVKKHSEIAKLLREAQASEEGVGQAELIVAAEHGDVARAEQLIADNVDVNAQDLEGNTALMRAAERGDRDMVNHLLDVKGADLFVRRKDGKIAGELASERGHDDIAEPLLQEEARVTLKKKGLNYDDETFFKYLKNEDIMVVELFLKARKYVNTRDTADNTALIIVARMGFEEIAQMLMRRKADVFAKGEDGNTALIAAAWRGHEGIVQLLLVGNADVNAKGAYDNTALMAATVKRHNKVAGLLRGAGASKEGVKHAELIVAAESGDLSTVAQLISENVDVNAQDLEGNTALMRAAERGDRDMVNLLDVKGADLFVRRKDGKTASEVAGGRGHHEIAVLLSQKTVLVTLMQMGLRYNTETFFEYLNAGNTNVVELFLKAGMFVDTIDTDRNTALMAAAWRGYKEIVQMLVERQSNMNLRGAYGNTALMAATSKRHSEVARLLREVGASEEGIGKAELIVAAESGDVARVAQLISDGVDVNARDLEGNTALIRSVLRGRQEVVKLLIEERANVYLKGSDGKTAREIAIESRYTDIEDLLREIQAKERIVNWNIGYDSKSFFTYLHVGDITAVELFLKAGQYVDTRDNGNTGLIIAAWRGHKDIAQLLIDRKADVNANGAHDNTPLMAAALNDHSEISELLRKAGATEGGLDGVRLIAAAETGDVAIIEQLISAKVNVNAQDLEGNTALIRAAERGQRKVAEVLVNARAILEKENDKGMTAYEVAEHQRHLDIVKLLLTRGAKDRGSGAGLFHAIEIGNLATIETQIQPYNLGSMNMEGATPLIVAAEKGNLEAVRLLISMGADVHAKDARGRTALLVATLQEHIEVVRELIAKGADPEATDLNGVSPISVAIKADMREIQEILLSSGKRRVEMEARLVEAVEKGDVQQVRTLLFKLKVNPNARVEHGRTPLIAACEFEQVEIASLLLDNGADPEEPDSDGVTPIMVAIRYRRDSLEEMLRAKGVEEGADEARLLVAAEENEDDRVSVLVSKHVNLNAKGKHGRTALMVAAEHGHIEVARKLISGLADVNVRDKDRRTALMIASEYGRAEVVRELIEHEAEINARDKYRRTALMLAAVENRIEVLGLLTSRLIEKEEKAELDAPGKDGRTALMLAASKGHTAIVRALIVSRVNLDAQDNDRRTALILATIPGNTDVVQSLVDANADIDLSDKNDRTAYMEAYDRGYVEIQRILGSAKIKTTDQQSKLVLAVRQGNIRQVQKLVNPTNINSTDKRGSPLLILAIEAGHDELVRLLLSRNVNPNFRDKQGRTPIMAACATSQAEVVADLLDAIRKTAKGHKGHEDIKATVDEKDSKGKTALLVACERNLMKAVEALIKAKADVNVVDSDKQTPLKTAMLKHAPEIERMLRDEGATKGEQDANLLLAAVKGDHSAILAAIGSDASVDTKGEYERTPLIVASEKGHFDIVRTLVENFADVNAAGSNQETALLMASRQGRADVVRYLIEKKANVNGNSKRGKPGRTPLMEAARHGFATVVEELIRGHASVNLSTADAQTALILAAANEKTDAAKALINAKADVNARNRDGVTALMWAAWNGDPLLTDALIEAKANPNARSNTGTTPLMAALVREHAKIVSKLKAAAATSGELEAHLIIAAEKGQLASAQKLIEQKVNVNARKLDGQTALIIAAQRNDCKLMEELVAASAEVDVRGGDDKTPLMLAAEKGYARIVQVLIRQKADVNSRSNDGSTALMYASQAGRAEVVKLLLENGADVNAVDKYGNTASDLAFKKGYKEIVDLIEPPDIATHQSPEFKTICVTRYGTRYHRSWCGHLKKKEKFQRVLQEALVDGYKDCRICHP